MSRGDADRVARSIARRFPIFSLRQYVRWKVRMDPAYGGVLERLQGRATPIVDVGCGIGLLAHYLRAHGVSAPFVGIDFDERKIELAIRAGAALGDVEFVRGDARDPYPQQHDVVILDILQYFGAEDRKTILANAAAAAPAGGVVVIRTGIRDSSWRYRLTFAVDWLAWALRWMRAERLHFPAREEILEAFGGFDADVIPFSGRTPYNNFLFVFRKREAARLAG